MIEENGSITLDDTVNKCLTLGLNQQESDENISANRISCEGISSEAVSWIFPLLENFHLNASSVMICTLLGFVNINVKLAPW